MNEIKFVETFIIEEYKTLWNYYQRTLTERKHLFDWYLKIITLPSSLLGFLIINKSNSIELPLDIAAGILMAIFFIGFSLFVTYSKESRNAENYLESIKRIRNYICQVNPNLADVLIIEKTRRKNSYFFGIDIIKFFRSLVFVIVNSIVLSSSIELFYDRKNWITISIFFGVSLFVHSLIYVLLHRDAYYHDYVEVQAEKVHEEN